MTSEPIDVAQALKAAYGAAIEGDKTRAAGIEDLRQFDAGTHPAQHSQAAYDVWVRTKIHAADNDPRPLIDGELCMKRISARLKSRFSSSGDEDGVDDLSSTTIEVDRDLINQADEYVDVESDSELAEAAIRVLIDNKQSALTDDSGSSADHRAD
jgi:hypothetical protein